MAQKTITQSVAFVRAFDQSGDVGNHKGAKVTHVDDTQIWLKRRERIIGDFWTRRGNPGDERRFTRVGKTNQTNVREQFQFNLHTKSFPHTPSLALPHPALPHVPNTT